MSPDIPENTQLRFLSGGGEMGALIRAFDWASTPLGSPKDWPQVLKVSIRLLLSTGHPMFIWWGPKLIQFYNDAYRRSLGVERHPSALGQRGHDCWAEIWPLISPQIDQVLAGDGYTWNENQLVPTTRNGKREDVYWTYSYGPIDDPTAPNGVGGVLVVCTETTKQVLAEQRLKNAEARWRALFDQAPGFMCVLNGLEHRFEYANRHYMDMIGQQDILGKPIAEVLPVEVNDRLIKVLDDVYASGEAFNGVAKPLDIGSSQPIYMDVVYQPVLDEGGRVTGILMVGYDVSERVKASEELQEQDRRKDEFLAMLAHELRNPLAPIRNVSELLVQSAKKQPQLKPIGDVLARQVLQLSRLMDDLLDISRITQNRIVLQSEPVNLSEVIGQALESVQGAVQLKQHNIQMSGCGQPLYVSGDTARLVQCVSNVISNAIKYTSEGGNISVGLSSADGSAVITVADDGCGISADMLDKVFELFVQAKRTLDRSQGGLGVGLNIVKRMVQMHGGSVEASSEGLGRGSSFRISLPLISAPAFSGVESPLERNGALRILVVDDNRDAANTLAELLSLHGYEVQATFSAKGTLDCVDAFDPHILLLDIGLPDIDGYQLAQSVLNRNPQRVLIAITGYGQPDDVRRSKEAGFRHHFTKPVVLNELLDVFSLLNKSPVEM